MKFQSRSLTPDRSARHFYGDELRRRRVAANMSLVQLAQVLSSSKSTLARVENAEVMPPPGLSEALDAAFGVDGLFSRLYGLARREAHPDQYRRYMDFETRALSIAHYAGHLVPGLLQTQAYARAFFRCDIDVSEDKIEQLVAARLSRQECLRSAEPPFLWAILDEAVIRRPIGGPDVMYEQLAALVPLVDTRITKIQVLPFRSGGHALMGGATTLLKLAGGSVAYEEGRETGQLHETADAVEKRQRLYDVLRANSLSLPDSAELMRSVMEDYKPCAPLT